MTSASESVRLERDVRDAGAVYDLTVCNPSKLNVLGSATMEALAAALDTVAGDDEARVVVVRGEGDRAWIGGADIGELATLDPVTGEIFIRTLHRICHGLRTLPVPVVAAIRGHCLGAGLEVAACCDIRIADVSAHFGMPEVRVGIPSVIEAAVLPRLIGAGRARDLVLTGRTLAAPEALAWGLVETLTPTAGLEAAVAERVAEVLAGAPEAIRIQKRLCREWEERPLAEAVEAGIAAFVASLEGPEPREYLGRFLHRNRD